MELEQVISHCRASISRIQGLYTLQGYLISKLVSENSLFMSIAVP